MRNTVFGYIALAALAGMSGALVFAQTGAGTTIIEQAPKDHVIAIPKEKLAQYVKDMDAKTHARLVEGGKHSVTIRGLPARRPRCAPKLSMWYVMEGSGTPSTGGKIEMGRSSAASRIRSPGVEFIPAGLPAASAPWDHRHVADVRWDVDWPATLGG
jgi:hypothetical protein